MNMAKRMRKSTVKKAVIKDGRVMIPFRVTADYHRLLKVRLAERGETMQEVILRSLDHYLDNS